MLLSENNVRAVIRKALVENERQYIENLLMEDNEYKRYKNAEKAQKKKRAQALRDFKKAIKANKKLAAKYKKIQDEVKELSDERRRYLEKVATIEVQRDRFIKDSGGQAKMTTKQWKKVMSWNDEAAELRDSANDLTKQISDPRKGLFRIFDKQALSTEEQGLKNQLASSQANIDKLKAAMDKKYPGGAGKEATSPEAVRKAQVVAKEKDNKNTAKKSPSEEDFTGKDVKKGKTKAIRKSENHYVDPARYQNMGHKMINTKGMIEHEWHYRKKDGDWQAKYVGDSKSKKFANWKDDFKTITSRSAKRTLDKASQENPPRFARV